MYMPETIVLFIFGTIAGSFINALAFRHNTGKSMWGRSACTSCGTTLKAHDLVPIFSFLFLRGRCRTCKASISLQYPIVEVLAGILAVVSFSAAEGQFGAFTSFAFFMLLLFVAVYDMRHTIIPDQFVYAAAGVGLAAHVFEVNASVFFSGYVLAGFVLAFPLFCIWLFSKGKAMGLGDAKLMCAIGFFLGLSAGVSALVIAFWAGAIIGLLLLGLSSVMGRGGVTMKSEVPFGPFLVLATAIVYFFNLTYASLLLFF